jgi:hypothetical protein
MRIISLLWGGLVLLGLGACGPVYKTETTYLPPADERGKACVFQCENQRMQCDTVCRQDYQGCVEQARRDGQMRYLSAKESYLNQKADCLDRGDKDCGKKLSEPSESSYTNTYHCRQDCGCETNFERCFSMCGGQIQRFTRCVDNCQ